MGEAGRSVRPSVRVSVCLSVGEGEEVARLIAWQGEPRNRGQ